MLITQINALAFCPSSHGNDLLLSVIQPSSYQVTLNILDLTAFAQSSRESRCRSECRDYVIRAMIRVTQDYAPQKQLFSPRFWDYKEFFRSRLKWRFLAQKAEMVFVQTQESIPSHFLPHQLLGWQLGRAAACSSTLLWQPQRRGWPLVRFVVCLKSRPRETRNPWSLSPKCADAIGHLTVLKLREAGKLGVKHMETGRMKKQQRTLPQWQIFTAFSDTFFWKNLFKQAST